MSDGARFRVPAEPKIVTIETEVISDYMQVRVLVEPDPSEVSRLQPPPLPTFPETVKLREVYEAALAYQASTSTASVQSFVSALREALEFAETLEPDDVSE